MQPYLFKLVPPRPDFPFTMTDDERAVMLEHVGYWTQLAATGTVLAFGPVADPAGGYGIGVVLAEDLAAAERLRDGDPAMRSDRGFETDILPMLRLVTPTESYQAG
jgi:uncharacterized protein YciI